ncbi:hypothetical protein GGR24_002075 [Hansschlegelia beijingensis]|uniref:Acyloxyacyl hydrolase n=2 Tax=Hansschlegelia beijingensis TaxID=1133344 RepID=A0A7W6CYF7_9HYPH|nr:hypothetical protein [Hansschlegelia beijingensis]
MKMSVVLQAVGGAAVAMVLCMAAGSAQAADLASEAPAVAAQAPAAESALQFHSPFGPCEMNCSATIYVGRYISTPMSDIFAKFKTAPWNWKTKDSTLVSGSFSREVLTYRDLWAFETEIGVGKRFGALEAAEAWGALYWRWKAFPWNDYVRTTVAVSTGLNWASKIDGIERDKASHTSHVLHYLSPEITFGLPDNPNWDLVFRFHHRSGGKLAVFNHNSGGAQYQTVGLRYTW